MARITLLRVFLRASAPPRQGFFVIVALSLAACIQPKPLEVMGAAPAFQLTTQTGAPFDSQSLTGHVWVADFVYTTCQGPCPMMSSQMRQIQSLTAEIPDVKLVSFTVDPQHDTPPVLAEYAKHFKYDPARWVFLTGDQAQLNQAGLGFKLNGVDGSTTHSTRFVLVDRRQRIRGFYISSDDGFIQHLLHDIRQLERDSS
jgi:protein SCO1/2